MNPLWWRKDRGICIICKRPLGKRKLSHVIDPPPFCLPGEEDECKRILKDRIEADL